MLWSQKILQIKFDWDGMCGFWDITDSKLPFPWLLKNEPMQGRSRQVKVDKKQAFIGIALLREYCLVWENLGFRLRFSQAVKTANLATSIFKGKLMSN